jgi:hypothetical protein
MKSALLSISMVAVSFYDKNMTSLFSEESKMEKYFTF